MPLPRIIHRIWIGSAPTELQLMNLLDARQHIQDNVELWLWTNRSATPRSLNKNIVIRNIDSLWAECTNSPFPLVQLRAAFERESHGAFHNFASASDIARLLILYRYGGIYLDMDVFFKDDLFDLFGDFDDLGPCLGILASAGGLGNGVLAAMPRALSLEKCLAEIAKLYTTESSGQMAWGIKRGFGGMRMFITTAMSGPKMIREKLEPEGLLQHIHESLYFKWIDASGRSYTTPPIFLRRDSQP